MSVVYSKTVLNNCFTKKAAISLVQNGKKTILLNLYNNQVNQIVYSGTRS